MAFPSEPLNASDLAAPNEAGAAHRSASNRRAPGTLASITAELEELLAMSKFPFATPDAGSASTALSQALNQIKDYVRPRLESESAPVLAVIGGSTGAGKSTLINSLLGERVTLPGALRPTTRNPVLVHNPNDEQWFANSRILPSLQREHTHYVGDLAAGGDGEALEESDLVEAQQPESPKELRLVGSLAVPQGLALVDSPDVDSMVDSNRELAAQLLGAGDLWIFLTTAARYADAVPWEALKMAAARQTEIAIVVDRVDPTAMEVVSDLRAMLDANELSQAPLFVIEEQPLVDGFLPSEAVRHVREWLSWLLLTPGERDKVVIGTRNGAIDSLARTVEELAGFSETQNRAYESLHNVVTEAYGRAEKQILEETSDGSMLRGEVLSRWQDYVGTGEFMRGIEEKITQARDKMSAYFKGKTAAPKVQRAVGDSLYAIVKDHADQAAETVFSSWHAIPAGKSFTNDPTLASASTQLKDSLAYEIRGWQGAVLELVADQGSGKRSKARALAFGTNGLGVALMVAAFATTGGLTGAEVGIAGGTAVVAQRLLESVFGEDAVRKLASDAHNDLQQRVRKVLGSEQQRFLSKLDGVGFDKHQASELLSTSRALQGAVNRQHSEARDSVPEALADTAHLSQSGDWFGGGLDTEKILESRTDYYAGAVLYGSAGTRIAQDQTMQDADAGSVNTSAKPKWWNRIFKKGGVQ